MSRASKHDPTDTGVLVYPKIEVPKRASEPGLPRAARPPRGLRTLAVVFAGGLVAGGAGGFFVGPKLAPDPRVAQLAQAAADAQRAATLHKDRADELDSKLVVANAAKLEVADQLAIAQAAQAKLAEAEAKAKEAQAKLTSAIDKSSGSVSTDGDEIRLQLVDKVLFKVGDDNLTERGKAVLARVAIALGELPDKQIWVQGHTDDTPIAVPPAPKKLKKGEVPPTPRFATNWELSAARALTVVHYLQDTAKLDPSRLAALAFGQYRPVSRSNKAANRRIEIVLYPHTAKIDRGR